MYIFLILYYCVFKKSFACDFIFIKIFRNPLDLEGVRLFFKPVSSIKLLFKFKTSCGDKSFKPLIKKDNKPLVIKASEKPCQYIFPSLIAVSYTHLTLPTSH